ncbi:hypothetical protein [Chromobacterium violaceum]
MIIEAEKLILELVLKNDASWTWYQLERAIGRLGKGGDVDVAKVAESLVERGMLQSLADQRYPHPVYKITEVGKAMLL